MKQEPAAGMDAPVPAATAGSGAGCTHCQLDDAHARWLNKPHCRPLRVAREISSPGCAWITGTDNAAMPLPPALPFRAVCQSVVVVAVARFASPVHLPPPPPLFMHVPSPHPREKKKKQGRKKNPLSRDCDKRLRKRNSDARAAPSDGTSIVCVRPFLLFRHTPVQMPVRSAYSVRLPITAPAAL